MVRSIEAGARAADERKDRKDGGLQSAVAISDDVREESLTFHPVSIIVPVRDEEGSIERLLSGLFAQSYPAQEIVITDGGSTDSTRDLIRKVQASSPIPIVLIEAGPAFPGRGRNLAIERAAHDWVACIDAGIVPDREWLRQLVLAAKREPEARIIYGRYEAITDSYFKESAAITYLPPKGTLTPCITSCLLHRSVWRQAGTFREDLRSGEDLLIFRRFQELGTPTVYSREAIVCWELQPSLASTFRRFATYSRHGMKAGLGAEWQLRVTRLYLIMLAPLLALWWFWPLALWPLLILILRAVRRIFSWYGVEGMPRSRLRKEMLSPRRVLTVALINFVIDLAMFKGIWMWLRLDRAAA
jgi:glycosyltransferase involved in cell wall biosynthesis